MKRFRGILSYDGSDFSGYQLQPNQRTIQGELEKALQKIHKGKAVKTIASGRTDAGVHAVGQVFHFDSPLLLDEAAWMRALNTLLPGDIFVQGITSVDANFHARFDVSKKEYRYRILRQVKPSIFRRNFTFHFPYPLAVDQMRIAANHLIGTYDFTSFCSAKSKTTNHIRTIYELDLLEEDEELIVRITGNGFLYNMVRIIVGTLLEVGAGYHQADELPQMLHALNREATGKTSPAHGLYLWRVTYERDLKCN